MILANDVHLISRQVSIYQNGIFVFDANNCNVLY